MKKIVRRRADNSVRLGHPSRIVLAAMTGEGGLVRADQVEREIAKHIRRSPGEYAAFAITWRVFLTTQLGTPRELACRAFVNAVAFGGLTELEALEVISVKNLPAECISSRLVEDTDLPYHLVGNGDPLHQMCLDPTCHDHYFRMAVEDDGTTITVNMVKARVLHMTQIRRVRDKALAELDVPFIRAVEVGDTAEQQRIKTQKQVLRDIPQTFSLERFTTPETLKAAWPTEL